MGEDDGKQKYPPNSSDMLAMCEWIKLARGAGTAGQMRIISTVAGRMFDAWLASLDFGDEPTSGTPPPRGGRTEEGQG